MPDVYDGNATEMCFQSGLRAVVEVDSLVPYVTVSSVITGGSADELRSDLPHLVEHLWYRSDGPEGVAYDQLTALGARANGFTTRDATVFLAFAPAASLDGLLDLEARRLAAPLFGIDDGLLDSERAIVRSELAGSPPNALDAALYGEAHPYHPRDEGLSALTLDDVTAYVARQYRAEHVTLSVAGPLDPSRVQAAIERAFGTRREPGDAAPCARSAPTSSAGPWNTPPATPSTVVEADIEAAVIALGWTLPPAFDEAPRYGPAAVGLLSEVLQAAPLENTTIASGCSYRPGRLASEVRCEVVVRPGADPGRVALRLTHLLSRALRGRWFDQPETLAAIDGIVSDLVFHQDQRPDPAEPASITPLLTRHFAGETDPLAQAERRANAMSGFEEFAHTWLGPERMAIATLVPRATAASVEVGPARTTVATPPLARTIAQPLRGVDLPMMQTGQLDSGLTYALVPWGDAAVVTVALRFDGGVASEASPGADWMMWSSTAIDVTTLDEYDLHLLDALEVLPDEDGRTLLFTVDPAEVPRALALLGVITTTRHLETSAWVTARGRLRRADRYPPTVEERAGDARRAYLFPDELSSAARRDATLRLTGPRVRKWRDVVFAPENARLVVVGAITPEQVEPQVGPSFKFWLPMDPIDPPGRGSPPGSEPIRVLWFADDRENAHVTVSCGVTPRGAAARVVLEEVVRRSLWSEVRLATATYASDAWVQGLSPRTHLTIDAHVAPNAAGPAVAAILRTLAAPPSAPMVEATARWRGAVAAGELRSTRALALALARGIDPRTIGHQQAAVSADAVIEALAPCREHGVATVIGPAAAAQSLADAGLEVEGR